MRRRYVFTMAAFVSMATMAYSQPKRFTFRGGGDPNRGKCTLEVVVDGAAEVEVRGDTAVLRNLAGQTPQWRRFECNGPLPANPAEFRFAGVDGRGRQTLIQDPRGNGAAVIRIEDPQGGSEGYTFDIFWANGYTGGSGGPQPSYAPPPPQRGGDFYRDRDAWFRGESWRGQLFQRVRQDIEYVRSVTYPSGGDQWRLGRTLQELDELQGKLAAGRYDERELDEVIGALSEVLRDNRLGRRDRDLLADDLDRLRQFRARHEEFFPRRDDAFRGDQPQRGMIFQRVREDLDRIQSSTFSRGGDEYRFDRTRQELNQLQDKLAAGRYDERELDDVIGALDRVVRDNRMRPRDRDVLTSDLDRLRDFRARHDYYGAR